MIKEDDRKFVATLLAIYTILIFISLCLLLVSVEISILYTGIWVMLTSIVLFGVGGAYLMALLIALYEKLLGKGKTK